MALYLGIFARIGSYLGFGGADSDAQERSNEHNTSQTGYSGDDHSGQDGPHEKATGNHTPADEHGGGNSQQREYVSTDFEYHDSSMEHLNGIYDGQHGGDFVLPLSGVEYVSNDYHIDHNMDNDGGDLHAALAALPDTGAMLDAAISYLDSGIPGDCGSVDVTPFDDHGGSSSIT
jgi:hypothetical protein